MTSGLCPSLGKNLSDSRRIQKCSSAVAPFYAVLSGEVNIETAQETHDLSEGDFLVATHSSGPSRRCRRT
jgi:hypothetical protein